MTNMVVEQGRVVATPELRQTPSGVSVCAFTIAHSRSYKAKGEDKPQADFFDCKAVGATAEFAARYLAKGMLINVTGELETRIWEDKNGVKRKVTEIITRAIDFCEKKSDSDGQRSEYSQPQPEAEKPDVHFEDVSNDLDLPF